MNDIVRFDFGEHRDRKGVEADAVPGNLRQ